MDLNTRGGRQVSLIIYAQNETKWDSYLPCASNGPLQQVGMLSDGDGT